MELLSLLLKALASITNYKTAIDIIFDSAGRNKRYQIADKPNIRFKFIRLD